MSVEYEEGITRIGIPYKKLYINFNNSFDYFEITKYPRNIWFLHGLEISDPFNNK